MPQASSGAHQPTPAPAENETESRLWAGPIPKLFSPWVAWSPFLIPLALGAASVFCALAQIDVYESGPALVRLGDRTEVTARDMGVLTSIEVRPGQRVLAGAPLARFSAQAERDQLKARVDEWEREVRRYLTNPGNRGAYQAVVSAASGRRVAERRLNAQVVRAPHDGVVVEVRARVGQWLGSGELICALVQPEAKPTVEAYLPGRVRPLLKPGEPLLVELDGDRYHYYHLIISSIDDQVVGPAEAKRALSTSYAKLLKVSGPVVRVQASASSPAHSPLQLYDGASGVATVRVERRSLWGVILRSFRSTPG